MRRKLLPRPTVTVWGTGKPKREFIFVDDLAEACILVLERYSGESHLNIGTGEDITIAELAHLIAEIVGYPGKLIFDTSRPDGTPRKLLDVSKLQRLGMERAHATADSGIERAYADFCAHGGRMKRAAKTNACQIG